MSFLDRIAECNNADLDSYRPFYVAGERVGWIGENAAQHIAPFTDVFRVTVDAVALSPDLDSYESRTEAVARVLRRLAEDGVIRGWRDEAYPVTRRFGAPPLFAMERAAVPLFGIRAYGVHVNGYARDGDDLLMWIGRRAPDKPTYPDMLDNMVAGGQPVGLSLMENLVKEADEEASVPEALARRSVPVGAITYCADTADGLKPDVQFCYDLEVPGDFTPVNRDGEIAAFERRPMHEILRQVAETRDFKFNCNLVIIDFGVRHGLIPPDHPDYLDIVRGLRRG